MCSGTDLHLSGLVPHCLSQGQSAGPSLRQGQWVLEGKAVCGALKGKAAGGCHPSVTPSPPQGVPVGVVRVSPPRLGTQACGADSFLRYPDLYGHLKLPVSFLALFKRRNVVLLEK